MQHKTSHVTNVYVDAFNLYYGCLKGTPYRWLNLDTLCRLLLPRNTIHRIRYFTALAQVLNDPQQQQRQQIYLRALQTLPHLSIHYGHYLLSQVRLPLVTLTPGGPRTVEVYKMEEKGSDVNLASYLLLDAFSQDCEVSVVISNDSDLATPVRMVRDQFRIPVGILNPHRIQSQQLRQAASFVKPIRRGPLSASQFPPILRDTTGPIRKPAGW